MQRGMTALLMACAAAHEEAAKMLVPPTLAAGALDVCSTALTGVLGDYAGYSALLWAQQCELTSVVEMLLASGAADMRLPAVALFRGDEAEVQLNITEQTVSFARWPAQPTLRSTQRCPMGAKGYFELEILYCDYQNPRYGFVSAAFVRVLGASKKMVGDDGDSWAVDGNNQYTKHNDGSGEYVYMCKWKKDDVVGLACDLENMQLHVSVNGCFDAPNGLLFTLSPDTVCDGLFAAFTGSGGKLRYNMGEAPFKYAAPSADYKGFVEFAAEVTYGPTPTNLSANALRKGNFGDPARRILQALWDKVEKGTHKFRKGLEGERFRASLREWKGERERTTMMQSTMYCIYVLRVCVCMYVIRAFCVPRAF